MEIGKNKVKEKSELVMMARRTYLAFDSSGNKEWIKSKNVEPEDYKEFEQRDFFLLNLEKHTFEENNETWEDIKVDRAENVRDTLILKNKLIRMKVNRFNLVKCCFKQNGFEFENNGAIDGFG